VSARDPELVKAAAYEVDQRERHYPRLVKERRIGADEATIDFQAWSLILDFVDSGQLRPIEAGGIDGRTVVDWLLCEQVAQRSLEKLTADAEAAAAKGDAKADRLWHRRADVAAIARMVTLRRQSIETINKRLRAERLASQPAGGRKAA
jgi:hypothetical protein